MLQALIIFVLISLGANAWAQTLSGTIQIYKPLTKRSITASVPIYQRGPTVKLGQAGDEDPLDFERSHVLVYLEGSLPASASESHGVSATVRQEGRQFAPDLVIIPAGGTVSFPNMDPIFHNVFSLSHAKSFDLGSYDRGDARRVTFTKPGIEAVYCRLHPNMSATIFVAPNRWFAQSDREGHFHIRDVPPGSYTVIAWHKAIGSFRQPVRVEAGRDVDVTFTLPFAAERAPMPMCDSSAQGSR